VTVDLIGCAAGHEDDTVWGAVAPLLSGLWPCE
jgi:hypothetical protein